MGEEHGDDYPLSGAQCQQRMTVENRYVTADRWIPGTSIRRMLCDCRNAVTGARDRPPGGTANAERLNGGSGE